MGSQHALRKSRALVHCCAQLCSLPGECQQLGAIVEDAHACTVHCLLLFFELLLQKRWRQETREQMGSAVWSSPRRWCKSRRARDQQAEVRAACQILSLPSLLLELPVSSMYCQQRDRVRLSTCCIVLVRQSAVVDRPATAAS
jgi:hypothetical protein